MLYVYQLLHCVLISHIHACLLFYLFIHSLCCVQLSVKGKVYAKIAKSSYSVLAASRKLYNSVNSDGLNVLSSYDSHPTPNYSNITLEYVWKIRPAWLWLSFSKCKGDTDSLQCSTQQILDELKRFTLLFKWVRHWNSAWMWVSVVSTVEISREWVLNVFWGRCLQYHFRALGAYSGCRKRTGSSSNRNLEGSCTLMPGRVLRQTTLAARQERCELLMWKYTICIS